MPNGRFRREETTRRAMLASLGAAGAISSAGCLTTLPSFGQQIRFGDVDEPSASSPVYREWIPNEIEAYRTAGSTHVEYQIPGERGERTVGAPYSDRSIKDGLDHVGVDFQSFEYLLRVGRVIVGRANVDRSHVGDAITQTGYEPHETTEEFELYHRTPPGAGRGRTVAVGDEHLLLARESPDAIRELLDTSAGRRTRRHEAESDFALLTDEVGGYPVTTLGASGPELDGETPTQSAGAAVFDDSYAYGVRTYVFPEETAVSRSAVEGWLSESPRALDATRVDLRIDGRTLTVVLQVSHGVFEDLFGPLFEYPVITWGIEHDEGALRFVHEAGDSVDATLLTVRDRIAETPADEQFSDVYDTVEPGDSVTLDVSGTEEWSFAVQGRVPDSDERWTETGFNHTRVE